MFHNQGEKSSNLMPDANWAIPCSITSKLFLRNVLPTILHNISTKGMHSEAGTLQ